MKTLIQHGNVIDCTKEQPQPHRNWILVDDGKIIDIGHEGIENETPSYDKYIDACGCFIMPGLINLHVHIQRRHLHQKDSPSTIQGGTKYVENLKDTWRMVLAVKNAWYELKQGVTTIRDCSSKNRTNIDLREMISSGVVRGPHIIACGLGVAATGGHETHHYTGAVEADGPDEVRKAVRNEIKQGADFVKFMAGGGMAAMPEHEDPRWVEFSVKELLAGVEEAHNRNKMTAAHAIGTGSILNALLAGIDCIEHGAMLDDYALELMVKNGTFYVPTASGLANVYKRELAMGKPEVAKLMNSVVVEPLMNSILKAYKLGIPIGTGTDTLGEIIQEIQILHECGFSKLDALRAATAVSSRICGKEHLLGTVEIGKQADLLILESNPLEDIENLRKIRCVIKSGTIVSDEWLVGKVD